MERYQAMLQLKEIYDDILSVGDGERYLQREAEVDNLFHMLELSEDEPYNSIEIELLQILSELNHSMESLLITSMNRMQQSRAMSTKLSKRYDAPLVTDSYFYDRKS